MSLHVVAHFRAAPGRGDELRELLVPLVEPTLTEDGCLGYRLHQDVSQADHFVFVEEWRDDASLAVHLEQPHLVGMVAAVLPLLAGPIEVSRLREV